MKELLKNRYITLIFIICLLFIVLIIRLFDMQWRHGEEYAADAGSGLEKKLRLTGDRGMILDVNGVPLAYDQNSYSVVFYKDSAKTLKNYGAEYTQIIRRTIEIIEEDNNDVITNFNIKVKANEGEDPEYYFYFPGVTGEDAMAKRIERWIADMFLPTAEVEKYRAGETDIEYLYWYMRTHYKIPDDVSFDEALKVLSVWQEVQMSSYRSYTPVTIAEDVSFDTVAIIEMLGLELDGMEIEEQNIRIYPKNELAAHIVGYMGRMLNEGTVLEYEALGYSRDDLLGISGIEAEMEFQLSANTKERSGSRLVEVNSRGKIISETEVLPPTNGNNVILTIDSDMQKRLEEALEYNIKEINSYQVSQYNSNKEEYKEENNIDSIDQIDLATTGAAVVLEVQTGSLLAMYSYPSYDPNVFTGGLSQENADLLYKDFGTPLFNKAISSISTPGSIFKMVTAVAGLMEGELTLEERISDLGPWPVKSGKAPACWVKPRYYLHQNQTVIEGLANSCNFFFFTIADRLGSERLNIWATKLGLNDKTNVELTGEVAGQVASQKIMYSSEKAPSGLSAVVFNSIKTVLKEACGKQGFEHDEEKYDAVTINLMDLVLGDTTEWGPDVRGILKNELDLDTNAIRNGIYQSYDQQVNNYMLEIKWDSTQNILTGIGQSVTRISPIGVARYVSALVNGGNVYDATIIDSIVSPDGQIVTEQRPKLIRNLEIPHEYIDAIKQGMKDVVSGEDGTAAQYFRNFEYSDMLGGKTGTAQVSLIDLEDNAWFLAFAPFDQPEIVVVVMIPNGLSGGRASYTAREMIEYYLDEKLIEPEAPVVPKYNEVTP